MASTLINGIEIPVDFLEYGIIDLPCQIETKRRVVKVAEESGHPLFFIVPFGGENFWVPPKEIESIACQLVAAGFVLPPDHGM